MNKTIQEIRMVDLKTQYLNIKEEIDQSIQDVLMSSQFINGPAVGKFASELSEYLDVNHVIPCANGTDALQIALMGLGLKPGTEVIVPSFTYIASAEVIALLGLVPVFVDVEEDTFTMDLNKLEHLVGPKTGAIIPVHLYGVCANIDEILKFANDRNIYVIEDTAQALGADYFPEKGGSRKAGTISHIGTTSFFPSKILGCFGDGGALFTPDPEIAKKCKMIANHGQDGKKYFHEVVGMNSRLDTIQAAVLSVKLKYLDEYISARREAAVYYDEAFANEEGLIPPFTPTYSNHVYHQYTLKVVGRDRDELKDYLKKMNIPTVIYYPRPLHLQNAFKHQHFLKGEMEVTERITNQIISLPMHTELDRDQQEYIAEIIKNHLHHNQNV